jgi:hypothetical protein
MSISQIILTARAETDIELLKSKLPANVDSGEEEPKNQEVWR